MISGRLFGNRTNKSHCNLVRSLQSKQLVAKWLEYLYVKPKVPGSPVATHGGVSCIPPPLGRPASTQSTQLFVNTHCYYIPLCCYCKKKIVCSVTVTTSASPVPSINNTGHVTDWFDSLAECLHWNVRKEQKML